VPSDRTRDRGLLWVQERAWGSRTLKSVLCHMQTFRVEQLSEAENIQQRRLA